MKKYLLVVLLILLGNYGLTEETIEKIYQKAENLYNQIEDKTPSIKNIPRYKEISDLLEEIINKNPQDKELLKKTYQLLIISYDNQARYQEKYQTMKKYAQLLYPEDQEKQATYLKEQADKLKEQGEIAQAIQIYKIIFQEFRNTQTALSCCLLLEEIFEKDGDIERGAKILKIFSDIYFDKNYSPKLLINAAKKFKSIDKYKEAIECLYKILTEFKETKEIEDALFAIGFYYKEIKENLRAKEYWKEYLEKYPNGKYASIVKGELEKWEGQN